MRRMIVVLAAVLVLGAVGCGSKSKSNTSSPDANGNAPATQSTSAGPTSSGGGKKTHFAKTKFVIHAGLAFGAFHRYIYKPFKAGVFGRPTSHKAALAKAALAAVFAYHETKVALKDAQSSRILSRLVSPLTALQTKLRNMGAGFKHGQYNGAQINSANTDTTTASAASAKAGQPIRDQPTPSLGG